jgi:hypothetical protein
MYGISYMFRHYIAIFRERFSSFWELLNWGAVDRILLMGLLCLVHVATHNTPIHNIDGNVMPKHVGATIHN